MKPEILATLRHILAARIDNAEDESAYQAWCSARDIIEYAIAGNYDNLIQFDYLPTTEDMEEAEEECDDLFATDDACSYMGYCSKEY